MPEVWIMIALLSVGIAALLIGWLRPRPTVLSWQTTALLLLWSLWLWLLLLPQTADGWTMHALEGSYIGVLLVAVWALLIPVLLVTTFLHLRFLVKGHR